VRTAAGIHEEIRHLPRLLSEPGAEGAGSGCNEIKLVEETGMLTDPIADMLTRIRNAVRIKADRLDIPASKMKIEIAKILKEEGFIRAYKILKYKKQGILRLNLKYVDEQNVITDLKKISKPGRRVYVSSREVPSVMGGMGIAILTTSKGIFADKVCRTENVGGEVLCHVW
jgi:small subunit ribosomal protein S8